MMRQASNAGQSSSSGSSSDQKKSVFDRLGRQLEARRSMKRRPSPGQFGGGDYMPPPGPHEGADFTGGGRYGRDPRNAQDMEWRYQQNVNDRRHMPPFVRGDRHQQQGPLPPPPHMPPSQFEMELGNRQQHYAQQPHPYQGGHLGGMGPGGPPPPPPMPPMGLGEMPPMGMQRGSPKYGDNGNFKERIGGPQHSMRMVPSHMDHHRNMSPSRTFLPMGGGPPGMMHSVGPPPPDMPLMRPGGYPHPRWQQNNNLEPDQFSPLHMNRMMQEDRFSPLSARRFHQEQQMRQQQQQQQQQQMINQSSGYQNSAMMDVPRYTKWKERRDVITTLDRETAQSSSRTDSLKSTLQQPDNNRTTSKTDTIPKERTSSNTKQSIEVNKKDIHEKEEASSVKGSISSEKEPSSTDADAAAATNKTKPSEPQEISDGEIVGDEDSSDESVSGIQVVRGAEHLTTNRAKNPPTKQPPATTSTTTYGRARESHQYYETTSGANKKRRLHERDEYSMDYETISDEDLDDFMDDKKISDIGADESGERVSGDGHKSLTEIELLNALGLDWANLVELAKQSKTSNKETNTPGSALHRFSMPNYLPTLGISADLAGLEIHELITAVCRS